MSFQDIYTEATEAGIFGNISGKYRFDNAAIEQPDVLEYEEPSLYSTQSLTSPYFLKAPVCPGPAGRDGFSFRYPQPEPADGLCHRSITFESPTAPPRPTSTRPPISQLQSLANNSSRSPLSRPLSIFPTEQVKIQGKRPKKSNYYRSYDYRPLSTAPTSWDIFEYNCYGELKPGRTYTAKELLHYLYSNPQNQVKETYNPKLGGLTLWVQRTPQNFAAEYGHPAAGLCRFENCEHDNVIKAGDVRVAFDEFTKLIPKTNPQHNAGYVHLFCLEKKTDFPMLCKDFAVKPEARLFRGHKNAMMLQDRTELEHVQRFITFCNDKGHAPESYPRKGLLIDEILRLGLAVKRWQRRGVECDDEDKAKYQHSRDVHFIAKKDDELAKKRVAKNKRARAEKETKSESEEKYPREKSKARAITRPRGRPRKAPLTPVLEYDYDSSALTELDGENEEDEALNRKLAK